jgi:hypothetical protein
VNLASSLALIASLLVAAGSARADDVYAIKTLSFDEMVATTQSTFATYLKNLREANSWEQQTDRLVIDAASVGECDGEKFTLVPGHSNSGGIVADSLTFYRCGNQIGKLLIERTGPNVTPLSDDQLYTFDLPVPSKSETYRLRWTLYKIEFTSKATVDGRVSAIRYEIGAMPFFTRVEETEKVVGTTTTNNRRYYFDIKHGGRLSWVRLDQTKTRVGGSLPSFRYHLDAARESLDLTSAKYRELYSSNIEGNTIGNLVSMMQYPGDRLPFAQ